MRTGLLAKGAIFEIRAADGIVTCAVVNRSDITPAEGARCAQEMDDVLSREVLCDGAAYQGLVFDVRRGPAAFGPKTRVSLEKLFGNAERAQRRTAVLVGTSSTQYLQFSNLLRECDATHVQITRDPDQALAWVRGDASSHPH